MHENEKGAMQGNDEEGVFCLLRIHDGLQRTQGARDSQAQLRPKTLRRKLPALMTLVQISPSYSYLFFPSSDTSASVEGPCPGALLLLIFHRKITSGFAGAAMPSMYS